MIHAYKETYLYNAADKFGCMMDYIVNDCNMDADIYLHMFIISGLARQFERGVSKIIAGKSGVEIAIETIYHATGEIKDIKPSYTDNRSCEYWCGRALAHYQWYSALSFSSILRFLPFAHLIDMYPTLHQADITKFFMVAQEIRTHVSPQTNLRHYREIAGLTQAKLSIDADVSKRSIQMYEQRNKDINKAQAITLLKLSRSLGCEIEDLIEL
jgi:DNA-binding XRE family transcriptional regulator